MANGILDFFSREAGQQRRKALDEAIEYYTPPNLRGLLGFAAEMTPTRGIERAGLASQRLFAPDTPGWDRVSALGDMASEIAGVVAPAAVAGKVGMPAAQALQEGLMGFSTSPQGAALRNFAGDESGALRLLQGSPHDFNAERLVRMPDGSTQYIVGRPDVLPDIPPGAEVLRDFPLGRMRLDKIGTGEGAQVYGHGLYFAENEGVAREYRDQLTNRTPHHIESKLVSLGVTPETANTYARWAAETKGGRGSVDDFEALMRQQSPSPVINAFRKKMLDEIPNLRDAAGRIDGRLYEVNVNANPEDFLDWDKPLSEQSAKVRDAIEKVAPIKVFHSRLGNEYRAYLEGPGGIVASFSGATRDEAMEKARRGLTGENIVRSNVPTMLSRDLSGAGIPGIRYLDQGSRGAGDGSRNYVVFDDKLIDIVRKYGIAGAAAMLGVNAIDVEQAMAQGRPQPQGLLGYGVQ